jgi:hypothetical protein
MSFFNDEDEVTVCGYHDKDVQLIWTFSFPYKEFWCPYCGATYGMMGAGRDAKWTWKIHDEYVNNLNRSKKFLRANGTLCCARFKYKGEYIEPSKMPEKLRNYYLKQSKKWRYKV